MRLFSLTILAATTAGIALSVGCESSGPSEPACDLTVDTLDGKAFVMSEAQPKGPDKLNPLARLKFVTEDGKLKAKYTAMSLGDIYTYSCEASEKDGKKELKCAEDARIQDWCEALLAHGGACTKKKLKKLGATVSDADLDKAIKAAKASKKEAESNSDERVFKRWKLRRVSLANKLQGTLYAKVDSKCRLRIDDLYWTISEGKKVEDTNPVGTNPFVKTDEPYIFEHCSNQADLWDLENDAFPKEALTKRPEHAIGKPIYYFYTGKAEMKAAEGCTYSADTWAGWKPVEQGVEAKVEEGNIIWRAAHTFSDKDVVDVQGKRAGLFHMKRYKTCAGKKEPIDMSCRVTIF